MAIDGHRLQSIVVGNVTGRGPVPFTILLLFLTLLVTCEAPRALLLFKYTVSDLVAS